MVKIVKEEGHTSEESENYSLTGLFLKCNALEHYDINDKLEVCFKDENGTDQTHTGQIVRKSPDGIAIHYHKKKDLSS
ncbi:MAG: PilZ domain-containing protein [Proteobacteria bacterium]|nr:PilZ domain-containing protein [Pseudomonadota bacterium]